ncbi:MAG TPA: zf-HC2 domain-containing protein [Nocardioides sp.]|nr:zf-HC2 domain-containing protein [Nocardioides sp.]
MMQGAELTECAAVVELVTAYIEGELSAIRAAEVEAHLALCPGCTAYFEQVHQTIAGVRSLEADDLPAPLRDDLMEAFRREVPPR